MISHISNRELNLVAKDKDRIFIAILPYLLLFSKPMLEPVL